MTRIDAAHRVLEEARRAETRAEREKHRAWARCRDARERFLRAAAHEVLERLKRAAWERSSERGFLTTVVRPRTRLGRLLRMYAPRSHDFGVKVRERFVHVRANEYEKLLRLKIHVDGAADLGITDVGREERRRRLWAKVRARVLAKHGLATQADVEDLRATAKELRKVAGA